MTKTERWTAWLDGVERYYVENANATTGDIFDMAKASLVDVPRLVALVRVYRNLASARFYGHRENEPLNELARIERELPNV